MRTKPEKAKQEQEIFVNRDVSWLEFNTRVLEEAMDEANPLLERLKFLAIFSSNLDEFFMVRIAGINRQPRLVPRKLYKDYTFLPLDLLNELTGKIRSLVTRQYRCLYSEVLPALAEHGIRIVSWADLPAALQVQAEEYFERNILPVLTPIGIDTSHPFPLLPNLELELLVRLQDHKKADQERFAVIEVPKVIPRFLPMEDGSGSKLFLPAGEIIAHNLSTLFSGYPVLECSPFRITRDMDFSIEDDSVADLLTEMQETLQKKTHRQVIRLEIFSDMSQRSRNWLSEKLQVAKEQIYSIHGLLNLKSLFELASIDSKPDLKDPPMPPLQSIYCLEKKSMFEHIRENGRFMIHLPYESFDPVIKLMEQAAEDPNVLAIKQTLYRVSGNSPVVQALIRAARNGKQVTVLFEIKARFDEEHNIRHARDLAEAGAHVVYGIAGLKVHCKALLIVRREEDGIRRYVHLATGNYNDKTARQYTDLGFFSDDKILAEDVAGLFNVITGFSDPPLWNKLIVAPFNLRERLIYLIDREASLSSQENPGHIRMKCNSIIDYEIIEHLYKAAERHVKIELVVRGICGLNPFALRSDAAKRITIVSILDRFLEHSRIYYFRNNGAPEYFVGSADIMPRNLDRRIEILFPVDRKNLQEELDFILRTALSDRRKGRRMTGFNRYSRTDEAKPTPARERTRSQ